MDKRESERFINEFLMGQTAQEYVNSGLVTILLANLQKVNRARDGDHDY